MWQAQVRNRLLGVSLLMHMNLPDDLQEKFEVTSCILVLLSNMSSETMAFAECDRSACEDFWKWQWMRTLKSHSCTLRCKRVTYVWRLTWCYKKSCKARCDCLCSCSWKFWQKVCSMPDLYDEEFAYMHQPHQIHMERSDSAYDSEVR